jgi:hypothetical protein
MKLRRTLVCASWLAGCAAAAPSSVPRPDRSTASAGAPSASASASAGPRLGGDSASASASAGPKVGRGKATWDALQAAVARHHVFNERTEKNLGVRFVDEVAPLEAAFAAAEGEAIGPLVDQYVNALHDAHCYFNPAKRPKRISLGLTLEVAWQQARPVFYVATVERPELRPLVAPGDVIRSIDGVNAEDFLRAHALRSRANSPRGAAYAIASWLTDREIPRVQTKLGEVSAWTLSRGAAERSVSLTWKEPYREPEVRDDFALDWKEDACGGLPPPSYGPYELAGAGHGFCLYHSKDPKLAPYPIVRQHTFLYARPGQSDSFFRATSDQRVLAALLSQAHPKGVILDLRGNSGGNNFNWFLDWWSPGPWTDRFVQLRLDDALREPSGWSALGLGRSDAKVAWMQHELEVHAPGQTMSTARPAFCRPPSAGGGGCAWDNRYVPRHRVTDARLALLVDHGCMSTCDSVALALSRHGYAPLIGEPTAAAFTMDRVKVELGDDVGFVWLAFSRELDPKDRHVLEGEPLPIAYPVERTLDNRAELDALHVRAALRAFAEFPYANGSKVKP